MTDKVIENNQVAVMGEIVSDFSFSHEIFGEGFYMVDISVDRLSESTDIIPVMVSERLIDVSEDYKGMKICITGQFRSPTTGMRREKTSWCCLFLQERLSLWTRLERDQRRTRFFWTVIYARRRSTARRRWGEKSRICFSR